jgi:RNA polymerase sigma-70 factor (ECF subfamily)
VAGHAEVEQRYRLLFERNWLRVRAYAIRRCGDVSAADDAAAETFLVAWRRIGDIPPDNELAWLMGVARRVLANARRSDARRDKLLARLRGATVPEVVDLADLAVDASDTAVEVRSALGRLRPDDAEIIQLSAWEQLSHAQIAVVLDVSANAVGIRLHRARRRLAEELLKGSPRAGDTQAMRETAEPEP